MNKYLKYGLILGTLGVVSFLLYRRIKVNSESNLKKRILSATTKDNIESEIEAKVLSNALADNILSKNDIDKYITIMEKAKSEKDYKPSNEEKDFLNSFAEKIKKYKIEIADIIKIEQLPNLTGITAVFKIYSIEKPIVYNITKAAFEKSPFVISDNIPLIIKDKWKNYTIEQKENKDETLIMFKKNGVTLKSWTIDEKTKQIK